MLPAFVPVDNSTQQATLRPEETKTPEWHRPANDEKMPVDKNHPLFDPFDVQQFVDRPSYPIQSLPTPNLLITFVEGVDLRGSWAVVTVLMTPVYGILLVGCDETDAITFNERKAFMQTYLSNLAIHPLSRRATFVMATENNVSDVEAEVWTELARCVLRIYLVDVAVVQYRTTTSSQLRMNPKEITSLHEVHPLDTFVTTTNREDIKTKLIRQLRNVSMNNLHENSMAALLKRASGIAKNFCEEVHRHEEIRIHRFSMEADPLNSRRILD